MSHPLAQKYPHLEVSVLKLSEVKKHLILGTEFNSAKRQQALYILKSNKKVSDYFDLIKSNILQVNEAVYVYDLTHSLDNFLEEGEVFNAQKFGSSKQEAQAGDFIISRLRSYLQEMAVVPQRHLRQFFSTEYLVYRPRTQEISSNTLMVFALSRYVQTVLAYSQYGTEHPRFYEFVFNEMPIPDVIFRLNSKIHLMIENAYNALEQSKALYQEAQDLLSSQLGLDSKGLIDNLSNSNHTIKTLKESFLKTGRLDAEYYQEKYHRIEALIKNYPGGWDIIRSYFWHNKKSCPLKHSRYFYIEISDIAVGSGAICYHSLEKAELPDNAKILAKHGDLLVSKVRPNRGAVATIDHTAPNIIVSGAFVVLREIGGFRKEVLQVLLRLPLYKEYLLKWNVGTSYPVIKDKDILDLPIPKIPQSIQEHIAKYLQKSFVLRQQAYKELERAKLEVECALAGGGGGIPFLNAA
ncbi:hypothetical protein [Helicobacter suis]|uniref:hypothetical protein n=1 Tax=Helicobacter suis TaxID=104628 RepID=UPI0013D2B288|nr:hypothetical protein [Helicobacter suis]